MMVNIPRYPLPVKAKLILTEPTQMIQDRTSNEARDTPKTVWVTTAFSQRHDIQLPVKSEDMRMKISRKGDDVSLKNILSNCGPGEVNPLTNVGCYRGNNMQ